MLIARSLRQQVRVETTLDTDGILGMQSPVYLDYNATTPLDGRVLDRMLPYFSRHYGNASSAHVFGWEAEAAVDLAREQAAAALGVQTADVVFTSGATESINTAIKGVVRAYARKGRHIVTVQTEHSAVREACRGLERHGVEVTYLPVMQNGQLDPEAICGAMTDKTILVCVMWANNETGVLHPVSEIADCVRERGVLFMTDATQAVGKVAVEASVADILVCSAHKIYGPKGVGMLCAPARLRIPAYIEGGGQESGRRGGTLNVPGIVGAGAALEIAASEWKEDGDRLCAMRDQLEHSVLSRIPDASVNGSDAPRLPQTSSITFGGTDPDRLLMSLRSVAVSAGSACASSSSKPSPVLRAMGRSPKEAKQTLRVSLGRPTTKEEIDFAVEELVSAVHKQGTIAAA